jgi:hypothetical protein
MLIGVGPGPCLLPRTPLLGRWVNRNTKGDRAPFLAGPAPLPKSRRDRLCGRTRYVVNASLRNLLGYEDSLARCREVVPLHADLVDHAGIVTSSPANGGVVGVIVHHADEVAGAILTIR